LAAFELTDDTDKVWKMLLLRKTDKVWSYAGDWSQVDSRWTPALKAKVPFGIDPTLPANYEAGLITIPIDLFISGNCLRYVQIAHVRSYTTAPLMDGNYKISKYDAEYVPSTNRYDPAFGTT
jgi:hypothetical protein